MIDRPQIERRARYLVHDRHGDPHAREIDGFQIVLARVAGVNTKVIERRRVVVAQTPFVFFPAVGAPDTGKWPRGETRGAHQLPAAAVGGSLAFEERQLRRATAEGAGVFAAAHVAIARAQVNGG